MVEGANLVTNNGFAAWWNTNNTAPGMNHQWYLPHGTYELYRQFYLGSTARSHWPWRTCTI